MYLSFVSDMYNVNFRKVTFQRYAQNYGLKFIYCMFNVNMIKVLKLQKLKYNRE